MFMNLYIYLYINLNIIYSIDKYTYIGHLLICKIDLTLYAFNPGQFFKLKENKNNRIL